MFDSEAELCEAIDCSWTRLSTEPSDNAWEQLLLEEFSCPVRRFALSDGSFNGALPPSPIPPGLRRLQLAQAFNSPLLPNSVPCTVEVLHMQSFNYYLLVEGVTVLPSSLIHLVLDGYEKPLLPNTLPSSLQRLAMARWDQPLHVNVLPSSLRALELHAFDHPLLPGALPAGLTHLSLLAFDQPLQAGALPPALVSLDLGHAFQQPLRRGEQQYHNGGHTKTSSRALRSSVNLSSFPCVGVLPNSLRVFWHSRCTPHALGKRALPEELAVLFWDAREADDDVQPFVLPVSLQALTLKLNAERRIAPGALPIALKWLGLPAAFAEEEMRMQAERRLPASVNVWWMEDEDEGENE